MPLDRPARTPAPRLSNLAFAKGRDATLSRLVRGGISPADAAAWVTAWDVTTAGLVDFRRSDDFWRLGYQYAREEHARGFRPPALTEGMAQPAPALVAAGEQLPAR
jgi:hypothetical protein